MPDENFEDLAKKCYFDIREAFTKEFWVKNYSDIPLINKNELKEGIYIEALDEDSLHAYLNIKGMLNANTDPYFNYTNGTFKTIISPEFDEHIKPMLSY